MNCLLLPTEGKGGRPYPILNFIGCWLIYHTAMRKSSSCWVVQEEYSLELHIRSTPILYLYTQGKSQSPARDEQERVRDLFFKHSYLVIWICKHSMFESFCQIYLLEKSIYILSEVIQSYITYLLLAYQIHSFEYSFYYIDSICVR